MNTSTTLIRSSFDLLLGVAVLVSVVSCAKLAGIDEAQLDNPAPSICETYCDAVHSLCDPPDNAPPANPVYSVYDSNATCLAVCQLIPAGNPGDSSGNSIYCRLNQVAQSSGEKKGYCSAAGPGGTGNFDDAGVPGLKCGDSACASYCLLLQQSCPTQYAMNFSGFGDCLEQCDKLPSFGDYNISQEVGPSSINCRLYHVSAAIETAAQVPATDDSKNAHEMHCGHATGAPPCN